MLIIPLTVLGILVRVLRRTGSHSLFRCRTEPPRSADIIKLWSTPKFALNRLTGEVRVIPTDCFTPVSTPFRTGERPVPETDAAGDTVARKKAALRKSFLKRRRRMQLNETLAVSEQICKRLVALPEFVASKNIALYQSFDQEVNLKKVIAECGQQGKKVLLPRFNPIVGEYEMVEIENLDSDTVAGRFGIEEPRPELPAREGASLRRPDVAWLVPGVAFDSAGHRLGRGAGYFDRILTGVTGIKIGVAYDWQIVSELPSQLHDQLMNIVVSEKRVVRVLQPAG